MTAAEESPISDRNYSLIYDLYPSVPPAPKKSFIISVFTGFTRRINASMDALKFSGSNAPVSAPREWLLPIEDQGITMCCLSYAITYMLRARQRGAGKVVKSYSPRHMHFCQFDSPFNLAPPATYALGVLKSNGVVVYSTVQQNWMDDAFCATNQPTEIAQVKGFKIITSASMLKNELTTFGAVVAHVVVDDTFFRGYKKGTIYTVKDSTKRKAHCVCLIGFDDKEQCWIGVNSFGLGWGDDGFFKLSYDGCGVLEYETYPVFSIDLQ